MSNLDSLTGMYPLSKTLAFKLIPVGDTDHNIRKGGILQTDIELDEDFTRLKKLADEFHKDFIEDILGDFLFKSRSTGEKDSLDDYVLFFDSERKKNTDNQEAFEQIQTALRKQVAAAFEADSRFKLLDKKELITEFLDKRTTGADNALVHKFFGFTSYLQRYNISRMAIYSGETKSYSIASRIVDDNLPLFYSNVKQWPQIREILGEETIARIYADFEPYLNVSSPDELFIVDEYNHFFTQKQIEVYNSVLNGFNTENGVCEGINHYVHIYNQQLADGQKKISPLQKLKKQILSDTVKLSFKESKYETASQMMKDVKDFHQMYSDCIADNLRQLLLSLDDFDMSGIFLRNDEGLTQLSLRLYGRWDAIHEGLVQAYKGRVKPQKRKETDSEFYARVLKYVNKIDCFSIEELNRCMFAEGKTIQSYFKMLGTCDNRNIQHINHFSNIENTWTDLYPLVVRSIGEKTVYMKDTADTMLLKTYLENLMQLLHFIKPMNLKGTESGADLFFYEKFNACFEPLRGVVNLYNRCRNFITSKPYSRDKVKLNFGSSVLLSGWSRDKETVSRSVILRRDGKYYLAILDKTGLNAFNKIPVTADGGCEKMYYDLFGDASKMLPKIAFAGCNASLYQPSDEILRIRKEGSYKAGKTFRLEDLHTLIDFYKQCMSRNPKWAHVKWPWRPTAEYTSIKQFTDEFIGYDYSVEFKGISADYVDSLVREGKIYLFQIYNSDFSEHSKGTERLYTMYFKMLFDEENLKNVVYKLSGGAEMYFRKASIHPSGPTHPAGIPMENKRPTKDGKPTMRTLNYDLIKDKRFTQDQYMLHLPIAVNYYKPAVKGMPVTAKVKRLIREGAFRHVIGIHRGEKNLIYATVMDMQGHIVKQQSLNVISSKNYNGVVETDYNELLQRRSDERMQARKDWRTLDNIKNIKEGYISQAVSKIADMVLQYDALIVMESLDSKFKNSRQKIEKSIYQKFESQLVDKLSYLVKKDRRPDEPGGLLKAYQLVDRVDDAVYQNGIIFYMTASYTSNICPVTGFAPFFKLKYDKMEKVKAFFGKFDSIRYDSLRNHFEFTFDFDRFTDKAKGTRTQWTVCTHGSRVSNIYENGRWRSEEVILTDEFKRLFVLHNIDIHGNLMDAIATVGKRSFYEGLVQLFNLTVQLCNVSSALGEDYLISPVMDKDGHFFCTDESRTDYPVNTDANAAYNLARKGLMVIDRIRFSAPGEKIKMGITNIDWFNYIQKEN